MHIIVYSVQQCNSQLCHNIAHARCIMCSVSAPMREVQPSAGTAVRAHSDKALSSSVVGETIQRGQVAEDTAQLNTTEEETPLKVGWLFPTQVLSVLVVMSVQ